MDAVEFFKTVNRLCEKGCVKCPGYNNNDMCCMTQRMVNTDEKHCT